MRRTNGLLRALPLMLACSCVGAGAPDEREIDIAVLNGNVDSASTRNQAVAISFCDTSGNNCGIGCSGSLVTNNLVLTANHCVTYSAETNNTIKATYGNTETHVIRVFARHPSNSQWVPGATPEHQGIDVLLMKADAPFTVNGSTTGFYRALYPYASTALDGQTVEIDGWGHIDTANSQNPTTLRYAALPVESNGVFPNTIVDGINVGDRVFYDNNNPTNWQAGQLPMSGDSGGGLFINPSGTNYLAIVQAGSNLQTQAFGPATSTPAVRSWFENHLFASPATTTASMYSIPGISSQGQGELDVFWVNTSKHLVYYQYSNGSWHIPVDLGTPSGVTLGGNKPASVSWAPGRIDVFVQATNNTVYQRVFTAGSWQPSWNVIQSNVTSGPAVSSWGANRLDFFGRGLNGELRHSYYDNGWHMIWENLGNNMNGSPAAVSWGFNRIDVVFRSTSNSITHVVWQGQWFPSEDLGLGLTFSAGPAVSAFQGNRLDIFAKGQNGNLFHRWWDNGWLNEWTDTGMACPNAMAATSWGPGRIDVVSISGTNLWRTNYPSF